MNHWIPTTWRSVKKINILFQSWDWRGRDLLRNQNMVWKSNFCFGLSEGGADCLHSSEIPLFVPFSCNEYESAHLALLRTYQNAFSRYVIPCFVAPGRCTEPESLSSRWDTCCWMTALIHAFPLKIPLASWRALYEHLVSFVQSVGGYVNW